MPTTTILTAAQREHFLARGHVVLRGCFSRETAREWFEWGFERLGYDPAKPATWKRRRTQLVKTRGVEVREFAPAAYQAIGELCGGIDRVEEPLLWNDSFIFSLGFGADEPWQPPGEQKIGWHKDGDFFRHFLDSPEQGLLVIVMWSDIPHQGGGTFIACDSVPRVAYYLANKPEGAAPKEFPFSHLVSQCRDFEEITGEAGDVVLLHPFMLHTVSHNVIFYPRVISNPPVHLQEPMNFNRGDGDYSLVEQAVLRGLGVDHHDFQPTAAREKIVPDRRW